MARTRSEGTLRLTGSANSETVDADRVVAGDVRAGTLELDGSGSFRSDLSVDALDADGSTTVEGHLDGQDLVADGSTAVRGTLDAAEGATVGDVREYEAYDGREVAANAGDIEPVE